MKKMMLLTLVIIQILILSSCGSNFYNVVPVRHEYTDFNSFVSALENIEFTDQKPEKIVGYLLELDTTISHKYYIESITTTNNNKESTPEFPKMTIGRSFGIGMIVISGDLMYETEFTSSDLSTFDNLVISDYEPHYFLQNYTTVIKEVVDLYTLSVKAVEMGSKI